jgi:peroxiredoxin
VITATIATGASSRGHQQRRSTSRLHPFTFLAALIAAAAVSLVFAHMLVVPEILAALAYGSTLLEFKKYTSRYQFVLLVLTGALLGVLLDRSVGRSFLFTTSLTLVAVATICRQAFMQRFTYVNHLWFEPLLIAIAASGYFYQNINGVPTWATWTLPLLPAGFACGLSFGYVQDGLIMRRSVRFGYRIQKDAPAPDFTLPDENGDPVRLGDLRGQAPVLLLFVRGDWCPGCHMMLRTYEKHRAEFQRKGIVLLGIGPDNIEVNRSMVERIGVNYRMLSDGDQTVSSIYGVIYSNAVIETGVDYAKGIPLPASFLIDADGIVRYVSRPDRVGEFLDPELVFEVLNKMPDRGPSEWKMA